MSELTLPIEIDSQGRLNAVIMELRDYIAKLQGSNIRQKVTSKVDQKLPKLSFLSLQLLAANKIIQSDFVSVEQLLHTLEVIRDKAPIVRVTLADLPESTEREQLVQWFRTEVHPQAFLSFVTKNDIGGGALVLAGSHQYDFSFRTKLRDNKKRVAEIFNGRK